MKTKSLSAVAAIALIAVSAAVAHRDVTSLAQKANHRVHALSKFRNAVLIGANGTPATHHAVTTAGGIVKWTFTYNNFTQGSAYKSATLVAVRGNFGKVTGSTDGPFIGPADLRPIPKMTLGTAVKLLRAAGFTKGFYYVSLGSAVAPGQHTGYTFRFAGNKYATVDTKTGTVKAGF